MADRDAGAALVVEQNGPTMFAQIGVTRAPNRSVERVFRSPKDRIGDDASWHAISDRFVAVPELTRSIDIQLNKRLSLRRHPGMLSQPQIDGGTDEPTGSV